MKYFQFRYQHDQLTDLTIVVGMYTFKAHAAVLSCHSEYISGIVKKRLPVDRVTLNAGVSPAAFQVALLYMYTGGQLSGSKVVMPCIFASCHHMSVLLFKNL